MNYCPYCNGTNTIKQGMLPSGKKRFYCKDCKKGYSTYLVQDEPHLECVYCSSHNTVRAGKTKHGVQIYKCNDCGRRFNEDKTKLDFDTLCPHCGGVITYKGWSNDGTVRRYICKSCRRTFSGDVNHLNIKEKVVEKPCPYCGSHNVRKGGRLKSGLKRYKCNDCGKGYNENTVLITPKYRPEKCPYCGGTHINCSGHDTKTMKQRYKCIDCGKKFVENPTQHAFKVWEHECPKCGHKKARKAGRTQGKQYYQCLQCGHKDLEGGKYKHLSAKDVTKLRELYRTGIPLKYIASEMNRSQNSIRTLIKEFMDATDTQLNVLCKERNIRKLALSGYNMFKLCGMYNKTREELDSILEEDYKKETITPEQEQTILKFGVGCGVPIQWLAPYIGCSENKCSKVLSGYDIIKPKKYKRTETEKHQDWFELDKFIMR